MLQTKPCSNYKFWDFRAFKRGRESIKNEMKIFNWESAAKFIVENRPEVAAMSLNGDYEISYREIYRGGKIVTHHKDIALFCGSTWATPVFVANDKVYECYLPASQTKHKQKTYWPKEAREILEKEKII